MSVPRRPPGELLGLLLQALAVDGTAGEISVRGSSMHPTLLDGDRIQLVPAIAGKARLGDVVARPGQEGPTIHRLVGWWRTREGWRVLTKGDAALQFDPPLRPDCLVARVVARIRGDEVQRLDDWQMRSLGRVRAAVSLAQGLMAEAWGRIRRRVHQRAG